MTTKRRAAVTEAPRRGRGRPAKPKGEKFEQIGVGLEPEQLEWLKKRAGAESAELGVDVSVAALIRRAVDRYRNEAAVNDFLR